MIYLRIFKVLFSFTLPPQYCFKNKAGYRTRELSKNTGQIQLDQRFKLM